MARLKMRFVSIVVLLAAILLPGIALAQGATTAPTIRLMDIVTGRIDDSTPEQRWEFTAQEGDRVSIAVHALSGDLDAYVQVIDSTGRLVAEADDVAYPADPDAVLEDVAIPREGDYTIRVTRYGFDEGDTQGDFAMMLLPAFARPLLLEPFDGARGWVGEPSNLVSVTQDGGQLDLAVSATNTVVWAAPDPSLALPQRAYVQVEAAALNDPDYWEFDLLFRQTDANTFYMFAVSSRGDWAFLARTGASTWVQVRDWTTHPALAALDGRATLGVLLDGDAYTFYVNGMALDTVTSDSLETGGSLALGAGTIDQQATLPVIRYDNLLATEPMPVVPTVQDGAVEALQTWESRDYAEIVGELADRGLIPDGGSQVMLVPSSYTTVSRPGTQMLPLGQGRTQTDFVLGATVTLDSNGMGDACGLMFRRQDDTRYSVAFLDSLGGLGVSEWQGEQFDPAFYTDGIIPEGGVSQAKLLIVAQGDQVSVYVNGGLAAVRPSTPLEGGVGIASLSYDGRFVNCEFGDTWLWSWN